MKQIGRKGFVILFWIGVWYLLSRFVNNPILMVTPGCVIKRLSDLMVTAGFYQAVLFSLFRILAGFTLGLFTAPVLAALGRWCRPVEELVVAFMNLVKCIPVASFVVLFLIWWGSSFLAVAVSFLVVLPNVYFAVVEGLKSTNQELPEMAEVFGLPLTSRLIFIYLPALRPFLYSSLKSSIGMCFKAGVAAEVIGITDFSVGGGLYLSKIYLDTAGVFAWTAVVVLLSIISEKGILFLVGKLSALMPSFPAPVSRQKRRTLNKTAGQYPIVGIELQNIDKAYGDKTILEHFSAGYEGGKIHTLTWPSGSGKTTLLRIIAGIEQADSGRIQGSRRVAMVFQEDRLIEECSAVKNVELVIGDAKKAKEALCCLLEASDTEKPVRLLSGGMRRRVALVRAMEAEADVILLDEPFTGMDEQTRKKAENYIRERQQGRVILMATHILSNS